MKRLKRLLRRYGVWLCADLAVVTASLSLAWAARSVTARLQLAPLLPCALVGTAVYCGLHHLFGNYRRIWRYAAAEEVSVIAAPAAVGTLLLLSADVLWPGERPLPVSVVMLTGLLAFVGFVGVRYQRRVWTGLVWRWRALRGEFPAARTRVLIVG
ncbi:MAG: hypothetical protein QME94_18800, partial [Anaerolineae bacterium]|nr:hypothetical protein [Anaerolineae bacterium]